MKVEKFFLKNRIFLGALVVPSFFLSGCQPAPLVLPSYIQNIGVDIVQNQTSYFGLDTTFRQSIIHQFQLDARLPLEDAEKADLTVKVVIRQYTLTPISYDPKTNFPLQYQMTIVYDLAAIDNREKKTLMEDVGKSHSYNFYTPQSAGASPLSEDQARQAILDDAATLLVRRVLEGF
jgi:hypothetical protein